MARFNCEVSNVRRHQRVSFQAQEISTRLNLEASTRSPLSPSPLQLVSAGNQSKSLQPVKSLPATGNVSAESNSELLGDRSLGLLPCILTALLASFATEGCGGRTGLLYPRDSGPGTSAVDAKPSDFKSKDAGEVDVNLSKCPAVAWTTIIEKGGHKVSPMDIVVDSSKNSYITGSVLNSLLPGEVYVGKLNPKGKLAWSVSFPSVSIDSGKGVALDSSNNVYVVGTQEEYPPNSGRLFLAKLNGYTGKTIWQIPCCNSNFSYGDGITLDATGNNIYIIGASSGKGNNILIGKFNSSDGKESGIVSTIKGEDGINSGRSITIDNFGNFYISGIMHSFDTFPGWNWLGKVKPDGTLEWSRKYSGPTVLGYNRIAVDRFGMIYTIGSMGSFGAWLAKHDNKGELVWQQNYYSGQAGSGNGIALNSSGEIFITGTAWMGPGYNGFGCTDMFSRKIDPQGNTKWEVFYGTHDDKSLAGHAGGESITTDESKGIYVAGQVYLYDYNGEGPYVRKYIDCIKP